MTIISELFNKFDDSDQTESDVATVASVSPPTAGPGIVVGNNELISEPKSDDSTEEEEE